MKTLSKKLLEKATSGYMPTHREPTLKGGILREPQPSLFGYFPDPSRRVGSKQP